MKTNLSSWIIAPALLALLSTFNLQLSTTHAQGTAFTYQGQVTDNGTNFTGLGQFEFALVTGTNLNHTATAIAHLTSDGTGHYYVSSFTVTSGGSGYISVPQVTLSGRAMAHAILNGGKVTSVVLDDGGFYTSSTAPAVTIASPPPANTYATHWSNDGTSSGQPANAVGVVVSNGLFTVVLGDANVANMAVMDASLFTQPGLQLRIWFSDGVNDFAALDPAQPLTPAPYAVNALTANSANGLPGLTVQPNADDAPNVIGGSSVNYVSDGVVGATIGGGGATNYSGVPYTNSVAADFGTVSGGGKNTASGDSATVGGGYGNIASGDNSTVGGGDNNHASGNYATIGGGDNNHVSGNGATVGGGHQSTADGDSATVGGGNGNIASGEFATVAGGFQNTASGEFSFAAGQQAQALHEGTFVWADSQYNAFSSTADDQFLIRARGHVGINTATPGSPLTVKTATSTAGIEQTDGNIRLATYVGGSTGGGWLGTLSNHKLSFFVNNGSPSMTISTNGHVGIGMTAPTDSLDVIGACAATTFVTTSDRNVKEHFQPVSAQEMLAKVAALPVSRWNFKADKTQEHIGPMAQDFHAAFNVGPDDKHITTTDEGGVALAAIQGLNEKVDEKDAEIRALRQRLDRLEKMVFDSAEKH